MKFRTDDLRTWCFWDFWGLLLGSLILGRSQLQLWTDCSYLAILENDFNHVVIVLATTLNLSVLRWRIETVFCSEFCIALQSCEWVLKQLLGIHHKSSFTMKLTPIGWQHCDLALYVNSSFKKEDSFKVFAAISVLCGDHQVFGIEKTSVPISRPRKYNFTFISVMGMFKCLPKESFYWYSVLSPGLLISRSSTGGNQTDSRYH